MVRDDRIAVSGGPKATGVPVQSWSLGDRYYERTSQRWLQWPSSGPLPGKLVDDHTVEHRGPSVLHPDVALLRARLLHMHAGWEPHSVTAHTSLSKAADISVCSHAAVMNHGLHR